MVGLGTKDGLSLMPAQDIESSFPKLRKERYEIASEETTDYNCFAWAAHDTTDWWSPMPVAGYYWPDRIPRVMSLQAFVELYKYEGGLVPCDDGTLEAGFEKVALYVNAAGNVAHAARQTPDGAWTSKLGAMEDIQHGTLSGLEDEGTGYGKVVQFLKRAFTDRPG